MRRPCLGPAPGVRCPFGAYTSATRCRDCARAYDRARRPGSTARYGQGYGDRHKATVQAEPWCHTEPRCPYPDSGTPANPLTADHSEPVSLGGRASRLVVRCLRCNSSRGNRT
jgi:hypothetical protein